MIGDSLSRPSVRHHAQAQAQNDNKKSTSTHKSRAKQTRNESSGDNDHDNMPDQRTNRTTSTRRTSSARTPGVAAAAAAANKNKQSTTSSLPNTATVRAKKRPRLSSSSPSPSRLSSPPHSQHASPRRKRAPLTTSQQQTTLDKYATRKDSNNINIHNIESESRPAKKARLDIIDADTPTHTHTHTIGGGGGGRGREEESSPDPLDAISPAPSAVRKHTRLTTRSKKTVILADDNAASTATKIETTNDAAQPAAVAAAAPEKRSLRSHDGGSRSKSELALYFPNYEQIISLEPVKSDEILLPGTVVTLLDDLSEALGSPSQQLTTTTTTTTATTKSSPSRTRKQQKDGDLISPFGNPLLDLHNVEKVDLSKLHGHDHGNDGNDGNGLIDPLTDEVYFKAHRRHERQEKQLRNIERERAQHEKIQLDRLLDELQGHDWLRVMGISGITDTEKKLYEPKRDYFVKEVCALIDKFRVWKEEEKRRKLEREKMLLDAAAAVAEEEEEEDIKPPSLDIQDFDSNEVDAAAARQLIQEARSATTNNNQIASSSSSLSSTPPKAHPQPRRRLVDALTSTPPKARSRHPKTSSDILLPEGKEVEEVNKPFASFYPKRHLRDAAFSSSRRGGRNRSAFGQPLPEIVEEREFELPRDILTPELVHAMERKRRRLKRESRVG